MIPAIDHRRASATAILAHYRERYQADGMRLAGFVVALGDERAAASAAGDEGPKILATDVIMPDVAGRERLARTVLRFAESLR